MTDRQETGLIATGLFATAMLVGAGAGLIAQDWASWELGKAAGRDLTVPWGLQSDLLLCERMLREGQLTHESQQDACATIINDLMVVVRGDDK